MIIRSSMHEQFRSNAYLVADEPGGHAVFVDAGAPVEPLIAAVDELGVRVTHVLLTHEHHDHTQHMIELGERYGATLVSPESIDDGYEVVSGNLRLRALSTPGHCSPHLAWLIQGEACFTGDALFRNTVGGTVNGGPDGFDLLRTSVMHTILGLPAETTLYPGHMEPTSVAAELAENPFVRIWKDGSAPDGEAVHVGGTPATLVFEGPDYDGGTKAWIRFGDGREAIVGGSMLTRARE